MPLSDPLSNATNQPEQQQAEPEVGENDRPRPVTLGPSMAMFDRNGNHLWNQSLKANTTREPEHEGIHGSDGHSQLANAKSHSVAKDDLHDGDKGAGPTFDGQEGNGMLPTRRAHRFNCAVDLNDNFPCGLKGSRPATPLSFTPRPKYGLEGGIDPLADRRGRDEYPDVRWCPPPECDSGVIVTSDQDNQSNNDGDSGGTSPAHAPRFLGGIDRLRVLADRYWLLIYLPQVVANQKALTSQPLLPIIMPFDATEEQQDAILGQLRNRIHGERRSGCGVSATFIRIFELLRAIRDALDPVLDDLFRSCKETDCVQSELERITRTEYAIQRALLTEMHGLHFNPTEGLDGQDAEPQPPAHLVASTTSSPPRTTSGRCCPSHDESLAQFSDYDRYCKGCRDLLRPTQAPILQSTPSSPLGAYSEPASPQSSTSGCFERALQGLDVADLRHQWSTEHREQTMCLHTAPVLIDSPLLTPSKPRNNHAPGSPESGLHTNPQLEVWNEFSDMEAVNVSDVAVNDRKRKRESAPSPSPHCANPSFDWSSATRPSSPAQSSPPSISPFRTYSRRRKRQKHHHDTRSTAPQDLNSAARSAWPTSYSESDGTGWSSEAFAPRPMSEDEEARFVNWHREWYSEW